MKKIPNSFCNFKESSKFASLFQESVRDKAEITQLVE